MKQDIHVLTYNIHGLPWSRCNAVAIGQWIEEKRIPIVCLQEVFTEGLRETLTCILERAGYDVRRPRDGDTAWLPSGLLTAFRRDMYSLKSECFQPFLNYAYTDTFANKGFHVLWLERVDASRQRETERSSVSIAGCKQPARVFLVNTHVQSDWEFTRRAITCKIRHRQAEQMLEWFRGAEDPVLVVGDLNQETSLHPYLRFLQAAAPIKKVTFFSTSEDLDHVAWLPLQWARRDCSFCDIFGPRLVQCCVHQEIEWSDHMPVEMTVHIPSRE